MNLAIPFVIFFLLPFSCSPTNKEEKRFETMNAGELVNKHFFFSIPYEISSDSAAVITITMAGKPRRFMIDTGAPLVISESLQRELQFPILVKTVTKDSNGDTSGVEIVRVAD